MRLEQILRTAIDNKASDIHMAVGVPPVVRVNGQLLHMGKDILEPQDTLAFAKEILGERLSENLKRRANATPPTATKAARTNPISESTYSARKITAASSCV